MSIRLKIAVMFLTIASIPLMIVSVLTYTNYKNSMEKTRLSNLQDIVAFKTDKIETYFAGLKAYIGVTQTAYVIKKNLPVLIRLAGNPASPEFIAAQKMIDDVLRKARPFAGLSDVMLTDPRGKIVYSSNPEHHAKDFLKFLPDPQQRAIKEGKKRVCISDVFLNKTEGNKFGMLVTGPAFDFKGIFIGVIAFEIDMAPVFQLVQDTTGLGNTGETLVGKKEGNQVVFLNPLRHDPEAALKRKIKIGEEIGHAIQEAVQGRKGVGQFLDYRGEKVIAAWRYIPSLDWGIVAKIDAQEAFSDVTNLRNLTMTILAVVLILSGIMAFYISRSISEPIKKLSEGAKIVGSGNLDYKIETDQKDEIGQLSRSFDKMTQDLKMITASRDELNREIAERKKAELELSTSKRFLEIANRSASTPQLLQEFIQEIQNLTRCEAVGIRILDESGNIPYTAYAGFSQKFYEKESPLSIKSDQCMCINVIKGTTNPNLSFYTEYGSFYMNGTTRFLATVSEAEKGKTRNVCNAVGYESVALIPIRLGIRILGLVHLADHRDNMVPLDMVKRLEQMASAVGISIQKSKAEETLRKAHDELELRVQERTKDLDEANRSVKTERQRFFDVLEMLPVYVVLLTPDYHVPFANRFFRERFGESGGRRCYEYLFNRTEPCPICETYTVLKTNAPHHWEWTGPDGRNYDIFDYPFIDSDGSTLILEMGIDITDRKQAEKTLKEINVALEQRVAERTAELQTANVSLIDSRRAALNLMEDAISSHRQAEEASVELRQRQNEISALFEASQAVLEYSEFKKSARSIFDSCKRLIGASAGYVALLSKDGTENEVLFLDSGGLSCSVNPNLPMPIRGLRGESYRTNKTVYENDFSHSEWVKFMPEGHVTLDNVLFAPLVIEGKTVGLLGLGNKPGGFTKKDAELASAFGKLAAISLYNSKLLESLQKAKGELEQRVLERTIDLETVNKELEVEISERIEKEKRINATNVLLNLFTKKSTLSEYLDEVVELLCTWSGCRYVGIRILDSDGMIPYYSYIGFRREFWESENNLCIHRDQCVCTRIISGKIEPQDKPAITSFGSFRSDNSFAFISGLSEAERSKYRGVCIRSGFASLSVIPIRYRDKTVGAVHLADEREGMASFNTIEFIETMTPLIGEAIQRFDIEDELRRNYDAIQKGSELLENMFSSIHVMVAYMDREFNFIRVNRAYAEADGRDPEFYIGKNHFDLFPYGENKNIFRRVVETGEPYFAFERAFEYAEHPERGVTYWDWSLVPVKDPDGKITGVVLSLIDITERKRAEADRTRLAKAVEEAAEAIVITNTNGFIEYVNPAFERITGFKREEILGRDMHILDSGRQDEAFYQMIRETLSRGNVWSGLMMNKRKDGAVYQEECTISPVRDSSGEIINYVSVKRDVTEKLRLESIAEAVNTMENIGYIFTGIRHEIGNPINSMKMTLSVLKANLEDYTKSMIKEYIDRIQGELSRIEYILRNLKTFNMYENPELQDVLIPDFLEKFLAIVKKDFAKKGVVINTSIEPDAEFCYADPRVLQQVLLNVLTNASDALSASGGEREDSNISIAISKLLDVILIQVEDNGCGMTEKELKEIFRPFYTTKAHGTGLGLVIARKMLMKMNGAIDVMSQKDVGTKVNIFIPEGKSGRQ